MSATCERQDAVFDGISAGYKRCLWIVIAINFSMFLVEVVAGYAAESQALWADALDFFADGITYAISLMVIGGSIKARARVALAKGVSLLLMGAWVLGATVYHVFSGAEPQAEVMGAVAFVALMANMISVLLLVKYKDGDANVRSVWLCSRNDAIGNVAVMIAAAGVWSTQSGWPDLAVAAIIASLFLSSAWHIIRQALSEIRGR